MSELRDRLAEYVSHKRVRAGEIRGLGGDDGAHYVDVVVAKPQELCDRLYRRRLTDEQWYRGGHTPRLGDRLVIYGEGDSEYLGISPKKAFEEGYSPVVDVSLVPGLSADEVAAVRKRLDAHRAAVGDGRPHDILWAAQRMQDGKQVRRAIWHPSVVSIFSGERTPNAPQAPLFLTFGGAVEYRPTMADLLATDWEIAP